MSPDTVSRSAEPTPIFGLTQADLRPIVEAAAGEAVTDFDFRIEHGG